MKFIVDIVKRISFQEPKKILGRWNIDYCYNKMSKKVDLSNEDHCGPCGSQNLYKDVKTKEIVVFKKVS